VGPATTHRPLESPGAAAAHPVAEGRAFSRSARSAGRLNQPQFPAARQCGEACAGHPGFRSRPLSTTTRRCRRRSPLTCRGGAAVVAAGLQASTTKVPPQGALHPPGPGTHLGVGAPRLMGGSLPPQRAIRRPSTTASSHSQSTPPRAARAILIAVALLAVFLARPSTCTYEDTLSNFRIATQPCKP